MKRISTYIGLCSLLILTVSSLSFASIPENMIPARATTVGTINIAKILALPFFSSLQKEIQQAEAQSGIRFANLGELPWFAVPHGENDPGLAAFARNLPESVFGNKRHSVYRGIAIYKFGDDDKVLVAKLGDWAALGNLVGIQAAINAQKNGQTLAATKEAALFTELASKNAGLMNLAYLPTAQDRRKARKTIAQAPELLPLVDNLKGSAFSVDQRGANLVITITALSEANLVTAAANTLRQLKAGYQQQFTAMLNMYAAQMPAQIGQLVRQTWDSISIQDQGPTLTITVTLPIALLNLFVPQLTGAAR